MPKFEVLQEKIEESHKNVEKPENFPLRASVCAKMPFSYILGKATAEREIEEISWIEGENLDTKEDSFVTVEALEMTVEHAVSNPQGQFNLSLPHKLKKVANYQQMSY